MSLHPLTERRDPSLARVTAALTFALVAGFGIYAAFQLMPLVGWDPRYDRPAIIDPSFLLANIAHRWRNAFADASYLQIATGGLGLVTSTLGQILTLFDLGTSAVIRITTVVAAATVVAEAVGSAVYARTPLRDGTRHLQGPQLLRGRFARRALLHAWRQRFGKRAEIGIELAPGLPMPRKLEAEHMLVVGSTDAGKTTILQYLLQGALAAGDRVLALDVKGDMTARWPSGAFAMIGVDDARSAAWDVGRDLTNPEDARELAALLIDETQDPTWSSGARDLLTALIRTLQNGHHVNGPHWSWSDLARLVDLPIEQMKSILESAGHRAAADLLNVDASEAQARSFFLVVRANAAPIIASWARMERKAKTRLSVRDWARGNGPPSLLIKLSLRYPQVSRKIGALLVTACANVVAERAGDRRPPPFWLVLDEAAQLEKTEALPRLAALGRSGGVRLVVAVQTPAQLRHIYGQEQAQALMDNLNTRIIGRMPGGPSADEIRDRWIGSRVVEVPSTHVTYDANGNKQLGPPATERHPVVSTEYLSASLGVGVDHRGRPVVRALVVGHGDVAELEWPIGLWQERRPAHRPLS